MKSRFRRNLLSLIRISHVLALAVATIEPRRRSQRRAQALLLAVLIMLLAVLLGAGFLAIVSSNLNQTARIADKTKAIEASRAGIAFANAQLSGSSQGDLWRPVDVSPAPQPGEANYEFYYSQLDRVQGWANRRARTDSLYRDTAYGKFPDATQAVGDAPKFLVKVREVPANPADPDYEVNHVGELKITSIGLSDDDPNVFHRAVAYKNGRRKSPWASALRSVSNWKFGVSDKTSGVPYATNPQIVNAATTFPANNVEFVVDNADKPLFSPDEVPFNVVIVKKDAAPTVRGAVVSQVSADGKRLTFARLESTIGANETVQKAAALGIGREIDLINTGTASPYPADLPQAAGVLANGSLWLQGQIQLLNLSKSGTRLQTSGSLALDGAKTVKAGGDVATDGALAASDSTNFPGTFAPTSGVSKTDLVNDGWNKIGARTLGLDYSAGRDVEPFTPVRLDSSENLARYRALARGEAGGITIDNRDDIERVGPNAMTQTQLLEMLFAPTSANNYARTDEAAMANGASLEQRHLRGWVGPDEFLARGALVEITPAAGPNGNAPSLRVTLDARSDANPDGPDANKTWRSDNGPLQMGVYCRTFDWPKSGVILAEGNLRVRGDVATLAAPRSLTVISLGNIYVEGSLSVDNTATIADRKKLLLLARKNVIVNPTRAVLARTDAATIATNTAPVAFTGSATARTLSVANGLLFNKGDYVTIGLGQNRSVRGLITEVPTANSIKVSSRDVLTVVATSPSALYNVRSPLEARQNGTAPASNRLFFSTVDAQNAINRRIVAPIYTSQNASSSDPNRSKLTFDHLGERRQNGAAKVGLNIKAEDFDATHPRPADFTAVLTGKQPVGADGKLAIDLDQPNVRKSEKILRVYQNYSTPEIKEFNLFVPPAAKTISQFSAEIAMAAESREMPQPAGYRYVAAPTDAALAPLPAHALAGVGLRYEPGALFVAPTDSTANQRREDFNTRTQTAGFTIALATSVEYDLNGTLSDLLPNTQSRLTKYIGFNPNTGTNENDDQLTVDSSFYQPKTETFKSTLDARIFDAPVDATGLTTLFFTQPPSLVLRRATAVSDAATSSQLPDYQVRALKLENINRTDRAIKPVTQALQINAFVYAQQGSWLVIAGDYFRSSPPVRGIADGTGKVVGSYVDYNNSKTIEANEYILRDPNDASSAKIADLNRNGKYDGGEIEAALRFTRYNVAPIQFLGAISENQSAVVGDVAAITMGAVPVVKGAVQDWTDKWTTYNDNGAANADVGKPNLFGFISYSYDPSLAKGTDGANELRVPVTDELIYQE